MGENASLTIDPAIRTAEIRSEIKLLRKKVRDFYCKHLMGRVEAVLEACRSWKIDIVVFPEYSLPWEILPQIARTADDMVVVAGTHAVDSAAIKEKVYTQLGWESDVVPELGMAVCPVLRSGRLIALQPKLNPAKPEEGHLRPGKNWQPVELRDLPGPAGIVICLDFLFRESTAHRDMVSPKLPECRFLAVPSLTPHYTLSEFAAKAWEEARRYGRPVLYSDCADGGGTSIYVDRGREQDLRSFPLHVGYLERHDEGMIVADVAFDLVPRGSSTRYGSGQIIRPYAAASFVHTHEPAEQAYATWLDQLTPVLDQPDAEAIKKVSQQIASNRDLLNRAGSHSRANIRRHRLDRLQEDHDYITNMEDFRCLTREVIIPSKVLPQQALRAIMAQMAFEKVWALLTKYQETRLGPVAERLREATKRRPLENQQDIVGSSSRVNGTNTEVEARGVSSTSRSEAAPRNNNVKQTEPLRADEQTASVDSEPSESRPKLGWILPTVTLIVVFVAAGIMLALVASDASLTGTTNQISDKQPRTDAAQLPLDLRGVLGSEHLISFYTATDVALISILDPAALDHRLRDDENWWIDDSQLLSEMNRGNGIFISTGIDGQFEVLVHGGEPRIQNPTIQAHLSCQGNLLYVGGFPPDGVKMANRPFGGEFFACPKGDYTVQITGTDNIIDLTFLRAEHFTRNTFVKLPHLDDFR